ncbi:hypothetical protein H6P81_005753 [Aristolochia fimbriata]|uniref:Uncharacterized protein n=1 Tax=Aristolochia fimbriata TaxID=158543 RepID=A0AAV7EW27_ARIFI|nr:hypothetical protein H6P81_005753 [Aristolochia fimbriata]
MGQSLRKVWGRVQGKKNLHKICDKVFNQYVDQTRQAGLELKDLHVATLLVYNAVNKHFPGPHKEPPSPEEVRDLVEIHRSEQKERIDRDEFYEVMLKWVSKDLRKYAANKFILALLAAPAMAELTKIGGRKVPPVGRFVEKVPTSIFVSSFALALVLLQDQTVIID